MLLIVVLLMQLLCISAYAAGANGTITVDSKTVNAGDTGVEVQVSLSGNTGILGMRLTIAYPKGLTLTGVTKGTALPSMTFTGPGKLSDNPVSMIWDSAENDTTNGELVTLTFDVGAEVTPGDYTVLVSYAPGDVIDGNYDDLDIAIQNGTITVRCPHKNGLTAHSAVDATCKAVGNVAYWSCGDCGKRFADGIGTTELTDVTIPIDPDNHTGGTEIRNAREATYTQEGYTGDTYCQGCGAKLEDGTVIPKRVLSGILELSVLEVTPGKATVRLTAEQDCTLAVALYTVTNKMVDIRLVSVSSGDGEQEIPVTVSAGGLRVFTARAFLMDGVSRHPLCQKYEVCIDWTAD